MVSSGRPIVENDIQLLAPYGIGLMWAWVTCVLMAGTLSMGECGETASSIPMHIGACFLISMILLAIAVSVRAPFISCHATVRRLASLLVAIGTFFISDFVKDLIGSDVFKMPGVICVALGGAVMYVAWGEYCTVEQRARIKKVLPLAVLFIPCSVIVTKYLPGWLSLFCVASLPILSGVALECSLQNRELSDEGEWKRASDVKSGMNSSDLKNPDKTFFTMCFVLFITYLVYAAETTLIDWSSLTTIGDSGACIFIGSIVLIVTMYSALRKIDSLGLRGFLRLALPILVSTPFLYASGVTFAAAVGVVAMMGVQYGLDVFATLCISDIARMGRHTPLFYNAVARACIQAGPAVGNAAAFVFLQMGQNLWSVFVFLGSSLGCAIALSVLAGASSSRDSAWIDGGYASDSSETLGATDAKRANAICESIARENGLTSREKEILELFACGRSVPFISESLCISRNTVDSHSKSIYRKLGIHSRNELLDLIEEKTNSN